MGRPAGGFIYTREQWQWVVDRYLEGYTIKELSEFLGVGATSVFYHVERAGVRKRRGESQLTPLKERGFPKYEA